MTSQMGTGSIQRVQGRPVFNGSIMLAEGQMKEIEMANKNLFKSASRGITPAPANTVNAAGGKAYSRSAESALAQYVTTGCFGNTYYAGAKEQLEKVKSLSAECTSEFLAKAAVYARKRARMKDTPALLLAILAARGKNDAEATRLLETVFPQVIDNQKLLRNFVQIVRSGETGRKSFGTAVKRMIRNWLNSQTGDNLFYGAIGNAPSLEDVVKMVHPKPPSPEHQAFYGYLLKKEHATHALPPLVKAYESFRTSGGPVPKVDFRKLTDLKLSEAQWNDIALNSSWNQLRMNLNTFQRHGVFKNPATVTRLAAKLSDRFAVVKNNAFPYQLLQTYKAVEAVVPTELSVAVQEAMEVATSNVPEIQGNIAVCVDTSSSMSQAVTGERGSATSKTSCVDVAALGAASILRRNASRTTVVPFDTEVKNVRLNPLDSVMTNAQKLALHGGGTDCSCALRHLNTVGWKGNLVIFFSDNESWYDPSGRSNSVYRSMWSYGGRQDSSATSVATEWAKLKSRNPKAKLVCVDLVPNATTQVLDSKDVLNIGSFSDEVFNVIARFANGETTDFAKELESVSID